MRVTMLSKLYPPWIGGLELQVQQMARALVSSGADVRISVVTAHPGSARMRRDEDEGIKIARAATIARIARTPITIGMRRLIRQTRPDILHFHSPNPGAELLAPIMDPRLRVVVTYYHDVIRQKSLLPLYQPVLERVLKRADRIIAWSEELVESSRMLRTHRDKVVVIPGGIDTRSFMPTPETRRRAGEYRRLLSNGAPLVLFVGRLVYYKGLRYLLEAARNVEASFVIAGEGDDRIALETHTERLGIRERIHFLGAVPAAELPSLMQASDMLVLPSSENTETFGLVQLEAHVSGKPTICTDLPTGVTSVNLNGVTGLVVPPRDSGALADAINRLLHDPELRSRLGEQAQRRALEEFDIGRSARQLMNIYDELAPAAALR